MSIDFSGQGALWGAGKAFAAALLLLACGGSKGSDSGSAFLMGPNPGPQTGLPQVSLCGGAVVGDSAGFSKYSGDSGFTADDWSVSETDLTNGEEKTLFTIDDHTSGVINDIVVDEKDLYAVTNFSLYRFNRQTSELSKVSDAPASPVATTFLGKTTFAQHLALSSTKVLTLPYDTEGTDSGGAQFRTYLGLFDRATNAVELTPVGASNFLEFLGDGYYFEKDVAEMVGPGSNIYHPTLYDYDAKTDTSTQIASDFRKYAFVGSTAYYTTQNDDALAYTLSSVSASGGAAKALQTTLTSEVLIGSSTKLYVWLPGPDGTGATLTELDPASGATRAFGDCDGNPVYANDTSLYFYHNGYRPGDTNRLVRVPL